MAPVLGSPRMRWTPISASPAKRPPSPTNAKLRSGVAAAPVDLMYGYVEGEPRPAATSLSARPQYVADPGLVVVRRSAGAVTFPFYVQAEVYGGLEQGGPPHARHLEVRAAASLRGDLTWECQGSYPQFQKGPSPAYGVALESTGQLEFTGASIPQSHQHRRIDSVQQLAIRSPDNTRRSTAAAPPPELLGLRADAQPMKVGGVKGGLVTICTTLFPPRGTGRPIGTPRPHHRRCRLRLFPPDFDGDSIFNFFRPQPMRTITGGSAGTDDELNVAASGEGAVLHGGSRH